MVMGLGLISSAALYAQHDSPNGDDPAHSLTNPTIVKIEFPDQMSHKRVHPVSTPSEKYVPAEDTNPIDIHREQGAPAKLFIKGRGSLNHIRIFSEGDQSGYPIIDHTFRGVNFEEINLANLADGNYIIEYISPHQTTEIPMGIQTMGAN